MNLRKLRVEKGLLQYYVANKMKISKRQIVRIENGQRKNINIYKKALAEIYGVPEKDILSAWEVTKNEKSSTSRN
ncbi:MAG: helix-turn-helix transcriptional regulator [Clostridium sp.]